MAELTRSISKRFAQRWTGSEMGRPDPIEIGEVLGERYRIVRLLGRGGMGAVYEAVHTVVQRRFAIKVLSPGLNAEPEALARFRREARAAGALENENIAAVVDFGQTPEGLPFIVMEHLDGQDLASLLKQNGPLAATRAISLVIQACRGLRAAHAKGIVHRDLKPENLFLTRRGDDTDLLKVLDFGIAKLVAAESEPAVATKTGTALGTCYYMSPEQARGAKDVDARTDIYSLGVVLYELLSGRRPHHGDSVNEILFSILTQEAPVLDTLRPGLPQGLSELVHSAMAKDIGHRPQSVDEFMRALGRHLDPRTSSVPDLTRTVSLSNSIRGQNPAVFDRASHKKGWIIVVVAAGLLAAAGALLFRPSNGPTEPPPAPRAASSSAPMTRASADVRTVSTGHRGQQPLPGSRSSAAQPSGASSEPLARRKTIAYRAPEPASSGTARLVQEQVLGRRVESPAKASSPGPPRAAGTESLYAP